MKKIKFGSVEILGYIGIILWVAVIFLRKASLPDNDLITFWIGILPNLAAAWVFTMVGKWVVLWFVKKNITIPIHFCICMSIFVIALLSEVIHAVFFNSPFDIYDILITLAAQIIIFLLPILVKDKYFSTYE